MTDRNDGVILLHGISRTFRSLRKMQAAIEAAGFATLNVGYASRSKSLEALARDIHPAIGRFADNTAAQSTSSAIPWAVCWRGSILQNIAQNGLGAS